jgi:hypothetical protein
MQLINEHVFLYSPQSGGKVKIINTDGVKEKFGKLRRGDESIAIETPFLS